MGKIFTRELALMVQPGDLGADYGQVMILVLQILQIGIVLIVGETTPVPAI